MYSENPNIFKMLILKDDAGKLKGRALVWNLDLPEGRIFMDRIYTVNDYDIEIFKNFAKDKGWLYRTEQRFGWFNRISDPTTKEIYEFKDMLLQVTIGKVPGRDYDYYPYLDTLSVYNRNTHVLSNNGELRRKEGHLIFNLIIKVDIIQKLMKDHLFIVLFIVKIFLEEEAVYVEIDESWIYQSDKVYVHNTGGQHAYRNSSLIVRSDVLDTTKYFLKEDCIYSDYMSTHVYTESSITAYLDKAKKVECIIHKKINWYRI